MKTKTIRQSVTFRASPKTIYEMLMDSRKHAAFTGSKVRISRKVGGKFTAYDDYISGTNLELVPNKKIVQSWRGNDWPKDHHSKATFLLKPVKGGTRLAFTQTGVPVEIRDHPLKQGWIDYYWEPMKAMCGKDH